jgi:Zn-finger nucleic acid-binding protein
LSLLGGGSAKRRLRPVRSRLKMTKMIVECPGCHARYDVSGRPPGTRARCRCGMHFSVPKPSTEAGALKCPSCGAFCGPDQTSCAYCHVTLAMAACPSCMGRIFVGSSYCPFCGTEQGLTALGNPELWPVRSCPRCVVPIELAPHWVADTVLDECPSCGGVWLEAEAFEKLLKDRDDQAKLEKLAVQQLTIDPAVQLSSSLAPSTRRAIREYIPCPDCKQLMNRKNFADISGVIIDVCRPHGIWFDSGELNRIIQFVKDGGLLEARRRETEKAQIDAKLARSAFAGISMSMPDRDEQGPDLLRGIVNVLKEILR